MLLLMARPFGRRAKELTMLMTHSSPCPAFTSPLLIPKERGLVNSRPRIAEQRPILRPQPPNTDLLGVKKYSHHAIIFLFVSYRYCYYQTYNQYLAPLLCSSFCVSQISTLFRPFPRLNKVINAPNLMTTSSHSDEELVEHAKGGDLQSFLVLYERYLPVVFNRVRYTVPTQDVEDVTQEIFFAMMKSLNSFQGRSRFSTWVRTLVNRRVVDYYRKRGPTESELDVDCDDGDCQNQDDLMMIRHALHNLSEKHREILLLRFADGLQFSEIAEQMSLSLEATKSLFRRAITALRDEWDRMNASNE